MRSPHPLFDPAYYLAENADVAQSGEEPYAHFLRAGAFEGRDPHPLFETSWYLERNPDVANAGDNPLLHFLTHGWKENRSPHPLFDVRWYLDQYPDVARAGQNPLIHYMEWGWREERRPNELFDPVWYVTQPQYSYTGVSPLEHYVTVGAGEGLQPHPLFDTAWYLQQYPDVRGNAFAHFIKFGADEKRDPHPLFDTAWYLKKYPDVVTSGMNPVVHFLRLGAAAGYDPHPRFRTSWYRQQLPGLIGHDENALVHYLSIGAFAGANPSPEFDTAAYLRQNPTVAAAENPLVHDIRRGSLPPKSAGRERIQVFRRGAMGDVLLLTPALKALRLERPTAEIVVTTAYPEILENNPYIDHLVRSRTELEGCDKTFIMDYELNPYAHIVESYGAIFGVMVKDGTPEIFLSEQERYSARALLHQFGIESGERFCAMQISTGWKTRNWSLDRFKLVAEFLKQQGMRSIVLGDSKHPSIDFGVDLRGVTNLRVAAGVIENAAMMVAVDSGLMHVGFAFRRPVISLFGCTIPEKRVPLWALSDALIADLPCRGCHHRQPIPALTEPRCVWDDIRCMDALSVEMVIDRIREKLQEI